MCPLVRTLESEDWLETSTCVTAQHRQMLDQVLPLFDVTPRWDLNVMQANQDLSGLTSAVLLGMRGVLAEFRPDVVLVQGDTTTVLATSLAAFYARIPVGHVEAGLRTDDIYSPWPEEMNRRLASRVAALHFAPTELARQNLLRENTPPATVHVTGNTVIDALFMVLKKIESDPTLTARIEGEIRHSFGGAAWTPDRRYVLVTGHRRESFGQGFVNICRAIKSTALRHPGIDFVYPVHRNPNVVNVVSDLLHGIPNVRLIEPLSYAPFLYLLARCHFVLTDSGGIQEEAPSLGKPVLVMRENTERPEAVSAGTVSLVGTRTEDIEAGMERLLTDEGEYRRMSRAINPYGDGSACPRIRDILRKFLADKARQPEKAHD